MESRFEITPEMEPVIEAQIGEHLPVADRYPGHGQVVVSQEGGIWVQEYRRPLDEGPARWWGFGTDLRFRCSVSLPNDLMGGPGRQRQSRTRLSLRQLRRGIHIGV